MERAFRQADHAGRATPYGHPGGVNGPPTTQAGQRISMLVGLSNFGG
jgi:hypothetical protein